MLGLKEAVEVGVGELSSDVRCNVDVETVVVVSSDVRDEIIIETGVVVSSDVRGDVDIETDVVVRSDVRDDVDIGTDVVVSSVEASLSEKRCDEDKIYQYQFT